MRNWLEAHGRIGIKVKNRQHHVFDRVAVAKGRN
jgi:hypothetical protein